MAVSGKLFGQCLLKALNKEIDWDTDTIKCSLHTAAYTPDQDAHIYASSLTNEVAASGNYATGGVALANKTITYTAASNVITLDADDAVWANSTITARTAVVYDAATGVAATEPLIAYQQSDVDIPSSAGEWRAQWSASGIVQITVS